MGSVRITHQRHQRQHQRAHLTTGRPQDRSPYATPNIQHSSSDTDICTYALFDSTRHQHGGNHTQAALLLGESERVPHSQVRLPGVEVRPSSTSLRLLTTSIVRSLCTFPISQHFLPCPPADIERLGQSQEMRYWRAQVEPTMTEVDECLQDPEGRISAPIPYRHETVFVADGFRDRRWVVIYALHSASNATPTKDRTSPID